MNKIEQNGKVAVLISPGFGAGWSTLNPNYQEILCMNAEIVQAILDNDKSKAIAIAKQKCGDFYEGGARDLKVVWVKKGAIFEVKEYDGNESLHIIDNGDYMVA